jgi:enamine deaminase RidA (YjgF/YER057c/UK114 family)
VDARAAGNVVFVSGCTGDAGDLEEQVIGALDRARAALETVGSRLDNVVKTFFLVTSLDDYARVRQTETEYYERHAAQLVTTPPAATLMVVPALARPELAVEYEVIAALDRRDVTYYPEFWGGRELAYPHVPKEHAKFARSQRIGNLVVVSGCQALDHETVRVETSDFAEQTHIVLGKVATAMADVEAPLENVLKTNVFVKDAAMLPRYRELEREFFGDHTPATTAFVVSELPRPEFLIEVEAFGLVDGSLPPELLFLSGCEGSDVESVLDEVRATLEHAGSSLERVVKTTLMLSAAGDHDAARAAEAAYYRRHAPALADEPPATTFLETTGFATPGASAQLDVIAARPREP